MKKIYVSALSARSGGGVTYLDNILPLFPSDSGAECHVIAEESFRLPANCPDNLVLHTIPNWMNRTLFRYLIAGLYFRLFFFRNRQVDTFFYPGGSIDIPCPAAPVSIVAFRNMLPFDKTEAGRYPLGYIRFRNWLLFFVQRASFQKATKIIFISEYARSVIKKLVSDAEQKSVVIYHGIDSQDIRSEGRGLHSSFPDGYVLYVSNLDVYKAQLEVIQAWKAMKAKRPSHEKLLLVGGEYRPYANKVRNLISELGLEDDVILTGPLNRSELPALYENAVLNIYASSCENCPNILLEILASGSPVICSSYGPMPEIGGKDLIYFDPYNPTDLTSKLCSMLSSRETLEQQKQISKNRALNFSWTRTASQTWSYVLG